MRFNVSAKIGGGFFLMGLLLVACGLAGYRTAASLSHSLDLVTGPAWAANDGARAGKIGIQAQLVTVDKIAFRAEQGEEEKLDRAERETAAAVERILSSGLVPAAELRTLQQRLAAFSTSGRALLAANETYRAARRTLDRGAAEYQDFLIAVEELAGRKMVDEAVDLDSTETKDVSRSDEWFATNAAGEARLALLSRLYRFQRFLDAPADGDNLLELEQALDDLGRAGDQIAETALFAAAVEKGPFAGRSYRDTLALLLATHRQTLAAAMEGYRSFRAALERYAADAETLGELMRQVEAASTARVGGELKAVAELQSSAANTILAAVLLGLAMGVAAYVVSVRAIARPIAAMAQRLEAAERAGDLTVTMAAAGGDEIAALGRSLNAFVARLRGIVSHVADATGELAVAAERMSAVCAQSDDGVRRQRDETGHIAHTIAELSGTVRQVVTLAESGAERARAADGEAASGRRVVDEAVEGIRLLAGEVEGASRVIGRLEAQSVRIGGVLDVIGAIADQTNLLALNAAIEAARAGEQGRGFAVVADEVRTLANRTRQSTAEIQQIIEQLQRQAREATLAMESGMGRVESTVGQAAQAGEALETIARAVTAITTVNAEIVDAAQRQGSRFQQVNDNVGSIGEVAEQAARGTAETSTASGDMARIAHRLQGLVAQFRV